MNLKAKLRSALAQMDNPTKSATADVGRFKYNYATLDQVLEIVKTALVSNELGLRQQVVETKWYNSDTDLSGIDYQLHTIVFDDEEEMVVDQRPYRIIPDAQQQGSFETYMRRYALMMAFGLAGEDDDGAGASKRKPVTKAKAEPKEETHEVKERSLEGFTALKKRLMAATKADEKQAANALIGKVGDPKRMSDSEYEAALAKGEEWVSSLEKSDGEHQ